MRRGRSRTRARSADGLKPSDIDWDKVRALMARSIRGGALSREEMALITVAWHYMPNQYTRIHNEEKEKAAAELNPLRGKES